MYGYAALDPDPINVIAPAADGSASAGMATARATMARTRVSLSRRAPDSAFDIDSFLSNIT